MGRRAAWRLTLNSALLDTSFLISLADPTREHHATADWFFRELVSRQIPIYLSAIAISEFQVKQSVNDLPLRNMIVLPFNIDHAMSCGLLVSRFPRDNGDDRVQVKDDLKLIAQTECEGITHLLSEDKNSLVKYLARVKSAGHQVARAVLLSDGQDASWFEEGQWRLPGTH